MMIKDLVPGWQVEFDRGPNWLFVRLIDGKKPRQSDTDELSDAILALSRQEFARRLVLELDQVGTLPSHIIGELLRLRQKVNDGGGTLRLCGLSDQAQESLKVSRVDAVLKPYPTRRDAIMGSLGSLGPQPGGATQRPR